MQKYLLISSSMPETYYPYLDNKFAALKSLTKPYEQDLILKKKEQQGFKLFLWYF